MRRVLVVLVATVAAVAAFAVPASADNFSGGVSPTIVDNLADLNGSGTITGADSWTAFYGDTDIISGGLDCNNWASANDGAAGDGVIDGSDDCTLIGYDGTTDGVRIVVRDGHFVTADGVLITDGYKLPTVFNATNPDDPDPVLADFAWFVHSGKVDANGNGFIDDDDCSVGIVGGGNILGVDCAFSPPSSSSDDGLVDLNGSQTITAADSCTDGCFFGLDVTNGLVQAPVTPITHARAVSLRLRHRLATNRLRARGVVTSDGTAGCVSDVPVRLQRRTSSGWRSVGRTRTSSTGSYLIVTTDRTGRYRAFAPKVTISSTESCDAAVSRTVRHSH